MSDTIPKFEQHWPDFAQTMRARLEQGFKEYGDDSFKRNPRELIGEIEEELLDVIGWAFIVWVHVKGLKETQSPPAKE